MEFSLSNQTSAFPIMGLQAEVKQLPKSPLSGKKLQGK